MKLPGKKHEEHENHERWLVSYADFITLLFAFFVVMYASSTNNPSKIKQLEESIRTQMNLDGSGGQPVFSHHTSLSKSLLKNQVKPNQKDPVDDVAGSVGDPTLEAIKQEMIRNQEAQDIAERKKLQNNLSLLNSMFKDEFENRQLVMSTKDKNIILYVDGDKTFVPGKAQLKSDIEPLFNKIARALDQVQGKVRISGHTDYDRIPASSTFQNHLEMSAARAAQFGSGLIQRTRSLEDRLTIESYGSTKPINKTGSIYQTINNSRIEITIHQN